MDIRSFNLLSVIIPCYNEEKTLTACVEKVRAIASEQLHLEIVIVDDCSKDSSFEIAKCLSLDYPEIKVLHHTINKGKGAALRTGFFHATGHYVAVQDADLEYNPEDLNRLMRPLIENRADVVIGSRFLSHEEHRVLYFWHYLGNKFLTMISNMLTDLNLTDMETCYKVFRREIIQSIQLEENRFGFEPEIVARLAHKNVRIYEMGISYHGRTYKDGKKIGMKDGFRALYCILKYNLCQVPWPIKFLIYLLIGGSASLLNLTVFNLLNYLPAPFLFSTGCAFVVATFYFYMLCHLMLFNQNVRWYSVTELSLFTLVIIIGSASDYLITCWFISLSVPTTIAKVLSICIVTILYYTGIRYTLLRESVQMSTIAKTARANSKEENLVKAK